MTVDLVVVGSCLVLWLLHIRGLVRAPLARSWPAFVIVGLGVGLTVVSFWLAREAASYVAAGAVVVLLVLPALAVRSASRALRFGQIAKARALARFAVWLRPLPVQRRFRRAVEISWRLSRGESLDMDQAITDLGAVRPVEREAHRVAFLSWTNDFAAMAAGLADPEVRAFALKGGMAAIVTTVIGETRTWVQLVSHYERLAKTRALSRRSLDSASTLTAMAAYLGDVDTVRRFARVMRRDLPAERVAFLIATAEQRAGNLVGATATIDEALKQRGVSESGRQRLLYRREHVLEPLSDAAKEQARATLGDVRERLRARQALAALGVGFSGKSPLSWVMTAVLAAVFIWETQVGRRVAFSAWGLVAPWSDSPDPYRLLSYAMLHVDVGHLVVNVLGLLIFGRFVEHHFGRARWVAVYVAGALAGGFAFLAFSTRLGVAIGASGAVMALFGATVARVALDGAVRRSAQGKRELTFLIVIAASQLLMDLFIAQSSGSAHAGGFVCGFVLGGLLRRRAE